MTPAEWEQLLDVLRDFGLGVIEANPRTGRITVQVPRLHEESQ